MVGGAKIDPTSLEIKKIEISVQEAILLKKFLLKRSLFKDFFKTKIVL